MEDKKVGYAINLFSADAAHMRCGSCDLYFLYRRNSNMGVYLIGHAIIAATEGANSWSAFSNFIGKPYPALDAIGNDIKKAARFVEISGELQ